MNKRVITFYSKTRWEKFKRFLLSKGWPHYGPKEIILHQNCFEEVKVRHSQPFGPLKVLIYWLFDRPKDKRIALEILQRLEHR